MSCLGAFPPAAGLGPECGWLVGNDPRHRRPCRRPKGSRRPPWRRSCGLRDAGRDGVRDAAASGLRDPFDRIDGISGLSGIAPAVLRAWNVLRRVGNGPSHRRPCRRYCSDLAGATVSRCSPPRQPVRPSGSLWTIQFEVAVTFGHARLWMVAPQNEHFRR